MAYLYCPWSGSWWGRFCSYRIWRKLSWYVRMGVTKTSQQVLGTDVKSFELMGMMCWWMIAGSVRRLRLSSCQCNRISTFRVEYGMLSEWAVRWFTWWSLCSCSYWCFALLCRWIGKFFEFLWPMILCSGSLQMFLFLISSIPRKSLKCCSAFLTTNE